MICQLYQKTPWLYNHVDTIEMPFGHLTEIRHPFYLPQVTRPEVVPASPMWIEIAYKFKYHDPVLDEYIFVYEHDGTYPH